MGWRLNDGGAREYVAKWAEGNGLIVLPEYMVDTEGPPAAVTWIDDAVARNPALANHDEGEAVWVDVTQVQQVQSGSRKRTDDLLLADFEHYLEWPTHIIDRLVLTESRTGLPGAVLVGSVDDRLLYACTLRNLSVSRRLTERGTLTVDVRDFDQFEVNIFHMADSPKPVGRLGGNRGTWERDHNERGSQGALL